MYIVDLIVFRTLRAGPAVQTLSIKLKITVELGAELVFVTPHCIEFSSDLDMFGAGLLFYT